MRGGASVVVQELTFRNLVDDEAEAIGEAVAQGRAEAPTSARADLIGRRVVPQTVVDTDADT
jgi:hypothetical protein